MWIGVNTRVSKQDVLKTSIGLCIGGQLLSVMHIQCNPLRHFFLIYPLHSCYELNDIIHSHMNTLLHHIAHYISERGVIVEGIKAQVLKNLMYIRY